MNKCIYELFNCRSLFFDLPFYLVLCRLETETTNVVSVCVCVCEYSYQRETINL